MKLKILVALLASGVLAASAQAATPTAAQKAKGQKITAELTRILKRRIKSPGGTLQIKVVR